ncbi:hypothetical protein LOD99_14004 [Oopsacas minuta]|uniref:Basic leucine zipper domain-containing protein n=1 Tax=Oopsacas minuta TaxID=111878 RepID=A0AAV7KGK2_9METZ|nr:hypothetical protein LOD99_14004 [Oopsacas minuta]
MTTTVSEFYYSNQQSPLELDGKISKSEVIDLDIKTLNRKIRDTQMTKEEAKLMKVIRRKQKMKEYGVINRKKEKVLILTLEEERNELFREYGSIRREIEDLKTQKAQLEIMGILDNLEEHNY